MASWGVGTKLASAYDQPSLGGVYKLSATREGSGSWVDRIKITEQKAKLTVPGVLDTRRYYQADGRIAGDMVFDINTAINHQARIIDPMDSLRQKVLGDCEQSELLLHPLSRNGKVVLEDEYRNAMAAKARTEAGLATLDESQKRMLNPHSYPVGLEAGLYQRRHDLIARMRGVE